ncbi:MAG: SDR family NAD(P)-dependent oxidoreductase [Bradyrhizobiaceae bacterium]|nr:SDR family NAD(P)-dependent oxidoreductase [Bradyrhizobiaceae bacterium]
MDRPLHVWVVGASKGIGAAIATVLTGQHHVTVSSRSLPKESIQDVNVVLCDVTNESSIKKAHSEAVAQYGMVDVLVYCAGLGVFRPVTEMEVAEVDAMLATNLRGMMLTSATVLTGMVDQSRGMVIDINSIATLKAFPNNAVYAATKSGSRAFMQSLREEVRASGVKIVELLVGATATDIWQPEMLTQYQHRMMVPDDVASVVAMVVEQFGRHRMHIEEIVVRPQLGDL